MEVVRLRQDLRASETVKDTAAVRPPKTAPTRKPDKDTIRTLRREVASLTRKNARLHKALERARERKDEIASLRRANARQGKKIEALRARNGGDPKEQDAIAHAGAGGGLSRSIRRRMSANRSRGMTTPAIWNVT